MDYKRETTLCGNYRRKTEMNRRHGYVVIAEYLALAVSMLVESDVKNSELTADMFSRMNDVFRLIEIAKGIDPPVNQTSRADVQRSLESNATELDLFSLNISDTVMLNLLSVILDNLQTEIENLKSKKSSH